MIVSTRSCFFTDAAWRRQSGGILAEHRGQ
jgi:hypothetical protein